MLGVRRVVFFMMLSVDSWTWWCRNIRGEGSVVVQKHKRGGKKKGTVSKYTADSDHVSPSAPQEAVEYAPAFEMIDNIETTGDFANLYPSKFYSLNFNNLAEDQKPQGTIEFRRPPASTDAQTCVHWAVWIMAFMAKATSTNWNLNGGIPRKYSADALKDLISQGVDMLPEISQEHLCKDRLCKQEGGQRPMTEDERREAEEIKLLKSAGMLHR
ncbi:hypothetical protein F503_03240 [Ophiostoma piceae UAMH 11346]|uniref:Uncharacterized protein n=1 Tax=Ophiostoma piceae (strain UAMH 11346) TaxID=1262450 RepID=S3CK32_OPHP1|nr:hypothetical protein F503_03240 [Ophiostoma piceae UAMH 11346]